MKVEHITAISYDSAIRDTDNIALPVRHHFTGALPMGQNPVLIPGTGLSAMVTVQWPAAVFTLFNGETPLFSNICCFSPSGRETALNLARHFCQQSPMANSMPALKSPSLDTFIITIPILPIASPGELMLCGEIELYIYNAIYEQHT